jgi:hypothetical protein
MLNAGRTGIIFRVKIKGFIDLNEPPSHPPSPRTPFDSTPTHQPAQNSGIQNHNQPSQPENNQPVQVLPLQDNNESSDGLHSPDFLWLTPRITSPRRSMSSLHITVGENHGVTDYILMARNQGFSEFLGPASPDSVQHSNNLPTLPQVCNPLPPQDDSVGRNQVEAMEGLDYQMPLAIQDPLPDLQAPVDQASHLVPEWFLPTVPLQQELAPIQQEALPLDQIHEAHISRKKNHEAHIEAPVPDLINGPAQQEVPAVQGLHPAPVMIPLHELLPEPHEGPRRSSRLAEKSQGTYISVMEKALKKKEREASSLSGTSKTPSLPR